MYAHLNYRNLIRVSGVDRFDFLQSMFTQDFNLLNVQQAVYTLRLNRMGRILGDAWIIAQDADTWWMDTENADFLVQELSAKRLRYRVSFDVMDTMIYAWWGGADPSSGTCIRDTRHPDLGWRVYGALSAHDAVSPQDYRRHALSLGVPDGSFDFEIGRAMPLPWGCEHAIGWDKGCYIGQEPVARSRYQGVVRQHILPVKVCDNAAWTVDQQGNVCDALQTLKGRLVSRFEDRGLALMPTDVVERPLMVCVSQENG